MQISPVSQSVYLELISGKQSYYSLIKDISSILNKKEIYNNMNTQVFGNCDTIFINEEFIFALNDQELEINRIDPSLVLAVEVHK